MNGEKLMKMLSNIDDDLIFEAENEKPFEREAWSFSAWLGNLRGRLQWRMLLSRVAPAMAVLVLFIFVGIYVFAPGDYSLRLSDMYLRQMDSETGLPAPVAVPEAAAGGAEAQTHDIPVSDHAWGLDEEIIGMLPSRAYVAEIFGAERQHWADFNEYHPSGLPMLLLGHGIHNAFGDGFGMQAFSTTNLADIIGNPPDIGGMTLETLPVFLNPIFLSQPMQSQDRYMMRQTPFDTPDTTFMLAEIERTAALLGLSMQDAETNLVTSDHEGFDQWVVYGTASWGEIKIRVYNVDLPHRVTVYLPYEMIETTDGLPFIFQEYEGEVTVARGVQMTEGLVRQFNAVLEMENPVPDISFSYRYTQEGFAPGFSWYSQTVYENSGDYVQQILGYNFHRARFVRALGERFNGDGTPNPLFMPTRIEIDRPQFMLSHQIGDYPIVTIEDAKLLLDDGVFISTVWLENPPLAENIAHVDIVYLTHWQEILMPFYRFKVELPASELWGMQHYADEYGIKTFGWFFVPAVHEEFIADFGEIFIHFN